MAHYGTLIATEYFETTLFRGVKLEQLKKPLKEVCDSIRLPLFTTAMRISGIQSLEYLVLIRALL